MGLAALADTYAAAGLAPAPLAVRPRPRPPRAPAALDTPQLSVVIVNFCQWKNTARLTRQLRRCEAVRRGAAEVVIVDNHSPASGIARKLARLSGVSVVRSGGNHGFARGVNRGGRLSRGEWVLLLNPDVTVADGFLDDVLEAAQRFPAVDPDAGVVGFQLRNRDGTRQASVGPFPTLGGTVGGMLLPRARRKCRHRSLGGRQPVPWATGGCLLVRRDCYEALRGLDESFFLYYEDVDFCRRARDRGWTVWYDPSLQVTHHFPLHTRKVPAPLRLITRHALLTYARKHWAGWQAKALGGLVWAEAAARRAVANARKDAAAADWFRQTQELVGDVLHDRRDDVSARIRAAAGCLAAMSAANDGRTADA